MTNTQKVVGIAVATGVTILTYTSYNGSRGKLVIKSASNNPQLKTGAAAIGTQARADKGDTTYTKHTAQAKYAPGYNNPMDDNR